MSFLSLVGRPLQVIAGHFRSYFGFGLASAFGLVLLLATSGALVALVFPKLQATVLMHTPENPRVTLPEYKRMMATYGSTDKLTVFLAARNLAESEAGRRLLVQSSNPAFWEVVAAPVFPISRRDQREIGEARDQSLPAAAVLLGVNLTTDARRVDTAVEMTKILSDYIGDAFLLERVRNWIVAERKSAESASRIIRADLLRLQVDIEQAEQRIRDTKAVLARYPESSRLEGRLVLSINANDGSDRYLSPLAQIVSLESLVSQRREQSRRAERELQQKEVLLEFFTAADEHMQQARSFDGLNRMLNSQAELVFPRSEKVEEWRSEVGLRTLATIADFERTRSQFGIFSDSQIKLRSTRSPVVFAVLLGMLALALLATVAAVRALANVLDRPRATA